ncbi:hypothetical protein EOD39_1505 [Acipenser ruthenus]|uniref:Uncharacterized protein n=1 Tax=Acipenser ruthenus TaxID=7906 RepID=A0A444UAU3_ACIRT|nr:hypothetical protein EOD39_1505 [Acipenser ruthenus]
MKLGPVKEELWIINKDSLEQFEVQYSSEPPVAILSTKPCRSTYLVILALQRHQGPVVLNGSDPGSRL